MGEVSDGSVKGLPLVVRNGNLKMLGLIPSPVVFPFSKHPCRIGTQ